MLFLEIDISPWGWSFLSQFLLIFYDLNTVKSTSLDLLLVTAAFEGYKWPWIKFFFHNSKDCDISYERLQVLSNILGPTIFGPIFIRINV